MLSLTSSNGPGCTAYNPAQVSRILLQLGWSASPSSPSSKSPPSCASCCAICAGPIILAWDGGPIHGGAAAASQVPRLTGGKARGDGPEPVARVAVHQQRGLAARRPGAAHAGNQREATFDAEGAAVSELSLEVVPDLLIGVEFRRVGGSIPQPAASPAVPGAPPSS